MENETTIPSTPNVAARAAQAATHEFENIRGKAGEALESGQRYVRENPGSSALSIFGLGCLVGFLVGWALAHEEEQDYARDARKLAKRWGKKLHLDNL